MADENNPTGPADPGAESPVTEGAVAAPAIEQANDRIEMVDLLTEMQRSYLDYSMAVIVGRALPEVRDGLKPVHRRVLYAMYDGGYRPDRGYFKCARVVGNPATGMSALTKSESVTHDAVEGRALIG